MISEGFFHFAWLIVMMNESIPWAEQYRPYLRLLGTSQLSPDLLESAVRVNAVLAGDLSTPSVEASRIEQAELLLEAIAALPPLQRQAIESHHLQDLPLVKIWQKMDRPKGAIAALTYRGMKTLRASSVLADPSPETEC